MTRRTLVCSSIAAWLNHVAKIMTPPVFKNLHAYKFVWSRPWKETMVTYYQTYKVICKYQHNTEEFCICNIHSISFTCPENVSSFRIKLKMLSTKCLSKSSNPESASSWVEQDGASSTLEGPTEFKGTGSIGVRGSELVETPSCNSLCSLDLVAFSLDNWTSFLTLDRWLLKKSRTCQSMEPKSVRNNYRLK